MMSEPEDFTDEITSESGELAIVDAGLLAGMEDNPLVQQAVRFPVKSTDAVFMIQGEYDDAILRQLMITPAFEDEMGDPDAVKPPGHDHPPEVGKGLAPVESRHTGWKGHDSSRSRKDRKTLAGIKKMKGDDPVGPKNVGRKLKVKAQANNARDGKDSRRKKREHRRTVSDSFIKDYMGQPLTEDTMSKIKDPEYLLEATNFGLAAMYTGWEKSGDYVVGHGYKLSDPEWDTSFGKLLYEGRELSLNFDWLYALRNKLKNIVLESKDTTGSVMNIVESLRKK